jgi:hypothetical protein
MENAIKNCPICNVLGEQFEDNKLVWYHKTTDNRGRLVTHKWAVKSGRTFTQKASDEDSVW